MRRWDWSAALTAAPAVGVVGVCSALPLAWMAGSLLWHPAVRTEFALDAFRIRLLGRTLFYNSSVAMIATLMGIPAGFVLGRGRGWLARVLWVILPTALLMPSLAYAYGWKQFILFLQLSPTIGPILDRMKIDFSLQGPVDVFRCIWSLATWLWAVPAGLIGLALRRMDVSVQQQALLDGALRRVTLRQLAGPIIASLAIVTVLATQEFSVYEPTGISVVATELRMVFDTGSVSSITNSINAPVTGVGMHATDQAQRAAAVVATAVPLLVVTVLLALLAAWGATRTAASDALSVGDWPRALDCSKWAALLTLALVLLNIGVPVWSMVHALHVPLDPVGTWLAYKPQISGAFILAAEAGIVALIAALSAGGKWVKGSLALAATSFLVGGQLLAIALIRIYNRPGLAWAYDISVVPVIAYLGRFGWLAMAAGRGTWSQPWREMRDVAGVDGAGALRTAFSVIWPLAWPVLLAGGLLVGALSMTEVPATVLLVPQNPQVLTTLLMGWVHAARSDPMIQASLLMMAAVLAPALAGISLTAMGLRAAKWMRSK